MAAVGFPPGEACELSAGGGGYSQNTRDCHLIVPVLFCQGVRQA